MKISLVSIALAAALATGPVQAAGDPAAGQTKSVTCAGCHMVDGNSANPIWPKLAGQHAAYLEKQLLDYKAQRRVNDTMSAMVLPLSEQDMADLAAYFAAQSTAPATVTDPSLVELGQAIYRGGNPATGVPACTSCHGPQGHGMELAGFPKLNHQHAEYVKITLTDFREGRRNNDMNNMMHGSAARLTDQEIAAVAQYIQGLH